MSGEKETYRLKFSLLETTPQLRNGYRALRSIGMSRSDVNMLCVGVAMVTDHALVVIGPPPEERKENT